ncbi:polysaccharide deacetylase family protein [Halalkalibacter okhensis]|uniref:Polysaccharide deacetylase n=1 Tax=Halalkalibacter okhensis TaxID=333138 RepID=A0A0B0IKG4_9BACI|nr:polysaccharide deacetylase family protein [Halalkalibacter okhensis]KHF40166.1 polysaccharide deacetylase [Halalkalibacter okhensis]
MKKIIVTLILSVFAFAAILYSINEISKSRSFQFFGELIVDVETDEKVVALTFDDGPGIYTDQILSILKEEEVKGTFFLTGSEIEQFSDEAINIAQDGHEIGNHSYSHPRMIFQSPSFIKEEIELTDELIRQIGYTGEIQFRPPYGKRFIFLPYYLHKEQRKTILWNIEPESYPDIANDSTKIAEYVVENIEPGSIILLHVMYESRIESLHSVEKIITELKERGYRFTTISELLEYD